MINPPNRHRAVILSNDDATRLAKNTGKNHVRITEQVAGWVTVSLARHAWSDKLGWEVSVQLLPTPQGTPQPVIMVVVQMASPIIGQNLVHMIMVQWGDLTAENIDTAVFQGVETLHQQRSTVLNGNGGAA